MLHLENDEYKNGITKGKCKSLAQSGNQNVMCASYIILCIIAILYQPGMSLQISTSSSTECTFSASEMNPGLISETIYMK